MTEVPGYRIERELGRGGMATVYLAQQVSLRRNVALKVLDPAMSGDAGLTQRFLREAHIAASLHHRHIVAIHDVGMAGSTPYLAMEYLSRGSIAHGAADLTLAEALRCVREIAGALDYAHRLGVIHRDVKPENILRHEDGAFLLADFGIAHVHDASTALTQEGRSVGTPAYMSPEQWRNQAIDGRADLYSLGVSLYQMLTGQLPYSGSDALAIGMQHLQAPIPELPQAYAALQGLLARMLAKDPERRCADGAEVIALVEALERDPRLPLHATPATQAVLPAARTSQLDQHGRLSAVKAYFDTDRVGARRRRLQIMLGLALVSTIVLVSLQWVLISEPVQSLPTPDLGANAIKPSATPRLGAQSVTVLPFLSGSDDERARLLADGLHDDLLNRLAREARLKVIARGSVDEYRKPSRDVLAIAAQLGTRAVVDGNLRVAGDRLRVNVQLFDVASEQALWAEQFDRELSTVAIFDVQTDIALATAKALAGSLVATPSAPAEPAAPLVVAAAAPAEPAATPAAPLVVAAAAAAPAPAPAEPAAAASAATRQAAKLDAYQAYRKAVEIVEGKERIGQRLAALDEATRLDPDFADAWALLGKTYLERFWYRDHNPADRDQAKVAIERAIALDPNAPATHATLGYYYYWGFYDYPRALDAANAALALAPNLVEGITLRAAVDRRLGRWAQAEEGFSRVVALSPRESTTWQELIQTQVYRGRLDAAQASLQLATNSVKNPANLSRIQPAIYFARGGDLGLLYSAAKTISLADTAEARAGFAMLALYMRDFDTARKYALLTPEGETVVFTVYSTRALLQGQIEDVAGNPQQASAAMTQALAALERADARQDSRRAAMIDLARAKALVVLGRTEEALEAAQRGVAQHPLERDQFDGKTLLYERLMVLCRAGEITEALSVAEQVLPYPTTRFWFGFRVEPWAASCLADPRFVALGKRLSNK